MQRTMDTDRMAEWTTERIRAAQYGDPWACDQVLGAHQPLVHALVSRALDTRPAAAVDAVVRDTLHRAQAALHTLPYPEAFRPWLLGLAVDAVLGHAAVGHDGLDGGGGWLDIQDAVLAAFGALEAEGLLPRYETAAALQWTPEDTAARIETAWVRAEAARSVGAALARRPRCPGLQELTAGWDGRPGAGWRDHLAQHTLWCALCGSAAEGAVVPSVVVPSAAVLSAVAAEPAAAAYGVDGAADTAAADAFAEEATRAYDLGGLAPVAAPDGHRATRGDRRRRRQAEERTRRRAAVAAGIAVVAVTGGAFSLYGGGRDGKEVMEANRAAAPGPDTPLTHDPDSLSTTPADLGATPSASTTSPGRTTASATPGGGAGKTATARPTTATPTPRRTTAIPTPTPTLPKKTAAPTTAAPKPAPTTASPTAGTDPAPGGGAQNDPGNASAADQVLSLVNAERAKAGCGPLTANATLARAAQGHSDDMAARDFFDHTNPDGADPGDRVTAAGYPWSTYGENIAMGQRTPEQVMEAWMNSPGHRANILNCDFKELGVGIHDDGGPYWTQVFGAR
ncbi:CAP domain-containing protein [Streptomyces sp. R302]|uniref:CAP domain-containing protein n=1 Tax=unclassified Streptomyces TaxID=2593676 RepID=UPI00145EB541|nr:CAP domain-containing protein [Streptomyces sp. R301]NML80391.1 CAP domain-containing protein [Streptomyces sp. R302]